MRLERGSCAYWPYPRNLMNQISFEDLAGRLTPEALNLFREMAAAHLESEGDRMFIFSRTFGGARLHFMGLGSNREFAGVDEGVLADLVAWGLLHVDYGERGTPNYRVTGEAQHFYQWLMQNEGSVIEQVEETVQRVASGSEYAKAHPEGKDSNVFVVHGRNIGARDAMFSFLESIGLHPIEWDEAVADTGEGSPYIGSVLDAAFERARAVVVLMTPDEVTYLRPEYASGDDDPECKPEPQARPNVLFEAGMAMGRDSDRAVVVELGAVRQFSDIAGRHTVRLSNDVKQREALAKRLETAGCRVSMEGEGWKTAGDFSVPPPPASGLPIAKRVPPVDSNATQRIKLTYYGRAASGKLTIRNTSNQPIENLDIEVPDSVRNFAVGRDDLPIEELPPHENVTIDAFGTREGGKGHFFLRATYGDGIEERVFVSLDG